MVDSYKNAIRSTLKKIRTGLSPDYKTRVSNIVCKRIQGLEQYRKAKTIGFYWAVQGEIDLYNLWRSAPLHGKRCFFPILNEKNLSFLPVTPQTLFKKNKYNISEPSDTKEQAITLEQLDFMILPLVAFDKNCTRLGMGAGYYDRTLERARPQNLFGVAYEFQRVDFIYPEPWDIPLDAVVTQKSIYWHPSG